MTEVFQCSHGHVKIEKGEKCNFSQPLCSARLNRSSREAKVLDGASDEGELSDKVCEIEDAPASFKSNMWKRVASSASRNEEGEKVADCGPVTEVLLYPEILLSLHSYKKTHCIYHAVKFSSYKSCVK